MQISWKELIDGMDLAGGFDGSGGLPPDLPVAEFASQIPDGLPQAFIDRDAQFHGWGDSIALGVEETAAPIAMWTTFPSTWLTMARWEPTDYESTTGSLYVEFLSLAMVRYDGVPAAMWSDFCRSKSKGQKLYYSFAHMNGYGNPGWPYDLLRYPQRRVTQAMKDANYARTIEDPPDFHLGLGR